MPKELLEGLRHFISEHGSEIATLATEGQQPDLLFVGCMDSRCNPATITEASLGKFFGHTPMGSIIPPSSVFEGPNELKAKLKYAIDYNDSVHHIVLMVHTQCGAIKALVDGIDDPDISPWVNVAKTAYERAKQKINDHNDSALCRMTEIEVLKLSLENLRGYDVVQKGLESGKIELHGWLYDMMGQDIFALDETSGEFRSLLKADSTYQIAQAPQNKNQVKTA